MKNFKKLRQMIEIQGNGNIVSKEITVSSFIRLHLSGTGSIELLQSEEEKIIIETDENLLDQFDVTNSGRTLFVTAGANFRKPVFTTCNIKVFLRQIDVLYLRNDKANVSCANQITLINPLEIKIQSVGNTKLNISAPSIKVLSQCEGNVTLKGKCEEIEIKNQSQGDFNSKEMIAESLTIKNMAQGNVELFANKTITIGHYGQGHVYFYGKAVMKDVKQYGDGLIQHKEM